jgi:hypothetical protein
LCHDCWVLDFSLSPPQPPSPKHTHHHHHSLLPHPNKEIVYYKHTSFSCCLTRASSINSQF